MAAQLSQEEKVVIFLRGLTPEVLDTVLAKLSAERRTRLRALLERAPQATADNNVDQALRELERILPEVEQSQSAAAPPPANRVTSAYAAASPAPMPAAPDDSQDPLASLNEMESAQLAAALENENPRTVGVILNQLPAERAGQLFKCLSSEIRREVTVHFTSTVSPEPEVLRRIARGLIRKNRHIQEAPPAPAPDARFRKIASMVRLLEKGERGQVLAALEEKSPEAAAAVRSELYQFEDLLKIDNRSMQKLLGGLDTKNLAVALKSADQAIKDKVLSNMSQRAQQYLNEEMELTPKPDAAQLQQARKLIVDTIQQLDQAGELVMIQD